MGACGCVVYPQYARKPLWLEQREPEVRREGEAGEMKGVMGRVLGEGTVGILILLEWIGSPSEVLGLSGGVVFN